MFVRIGRTLLESIRFVGGRGNRLLFHPRVTAEVDGYARWCHKMCQGFLRKLDPARVSREQGREWRDTQKSRKSRPAARIFRLK